MIKWISARFLVACLALLAVVVEAKVDVISVEENPEAGSLYPVKGVVSSGQQEGGKFLSVEHSVEWSETVRNNPDFTPVSNPLREWTYGRGVGTIPNQCGEGYTKAGLLCYKHCPEGYSTVAGVCWQRCPSGFTDHGATCTQWKWWPKTIAKHSFMQNIKSMHCPSGKENQAGLCYTPCETGFSAVGPLCFGMFGGADDQNRIRTQAMQQQQAALGNAFNGVVLTDEQKPTLRTDVAFNPLVCGIDQKGMDDLVNEGIDKLLDPIDAGAWINASLSGTVLMDFDFDAQCRFEAGKVIGNLNFNPSISAKVSTHMFDPMLHNMAGVDLGIMSVSVYELLPFRVYGTVGANLGMETNLTSTIDARMPPLMIDGKRHAHQTSLTIHPEQDLWVSADAYLRITSLFSFIPDLVQLGAEIKVHLLETMLPYELSEGVENYAGGLSLFHRESLIGTIATGRGYIDTYLRILGEESETFGNDADKQWDGASATKVFIERDESELLDTDGATIFEL